MPRVSITIPGKNSQPYRFPLDRQHVSIGRDSDNDIIIDCPSVSSTHCTMDRVEGGYILRDRNSTNGIKLGETDMEVLDLRNDSEVRVGDVKFDYTLSEEELDELDNEEFAPHSKIAKEVSAEPEVKKTPKTKVFITPPPAQPVLASSSQGNGFFYTLALLLCGLGALYAGLNSSYATKQKNAGREGSISLFNDIRDGRPPLPLAEGEEE